jgi:dTDP-4-amino-4,6-dideoxygalactose transaminase
MRKIPFFDYPGLFAEHETEFMAAIHATLKKGAYIMQAELSQFECELGKMLGVKHVLGVADGTVALTMALKLAGVGVGEEVIIPSHTFIATAAAVHHCGATPVLCDCKNDHLIDVNSAEKLVTQKTKVIMPVQLNGRVSNMDEVEFFARKHKIKIVEDSCQALGAKFKGRFAGTFGVAGSFSFYPAKVIGTFGDGGALILNDDVDAEKARMLRDHGRNPVTGKVEVFGVNGRLDNVHAAILSVKLKRHQANLRKRRHLAGIYNNRLKKVEGILLPPGPDDSIERYDIFQNYEIEADNRQSFREYLSGHGIGTILQWGGYMIHQFEALQLRSNAPYAEAMSKKFLMLPMHHLLNDDDVHYICDKVERFYNA